MEKSSQQQLFEHSKNPELDRVDFEILDSPELRERYVHLTDKLIHRVEQNDSDALIFLDKSARPVSWLFKELWPIVNPSKAMPNLYFLNIDREQWRPFVGGKESGKINVDQLPEEQMSNLRSIFTEKVIPDDESAYKYPTRLDGKKVLIVDEVKVTGDTLDMAQDMLNRALPESDVDVMWWMIPEIKAKPGQPAMNQELPVWYSDELNTGRGVGNRDFSKSQVSKSRRQRRGGLFLSTRLRNPDRSSRQLRSEIKQIAADIKSEDPQHKMLYLPDYTRDNLDEVFARINDVSLDSFAANRNS